MTPSYVTWLVRRDMTHSYLTWLIHIWHDSFICGMTRSYVTWLVHTWHDSFIRDMTHSYVPWLIHLWLNSFICDLKSFIKTWRISKTEMMSVKKHQYGVMSHMNESCRIWMSHVTYYTHKRVTSHDESCHTYEWVLPCSMSLSTHQGSEYKRMHVWMSHVTYEWVMSRMNESCHVCMSHVTYEWVVYEACHIWWIHVTCMNKSCHIGMSHVPYEWVMSHIWMSHVPYKWVVNEPCHVYTSRHLWISHVTYVNESCHTCERVSPCSTSWSTLRGSMSRHTHVTSHVGIGEATRIK